MAANMLSIAQVISLKICMQFEIQTVEGWFLGVWVLLHIKKPFPLHSISHSAF